MYFQGPVRANQTLPSFLLLPLNMYK